MPVFGVICEYDPFHLGHRWMLEQLHRQGPVVCAMSGCFTQRGEFAAVNKFARAEMAVRNGADLVLELPTPWAVSGAERFARGGVELLKKTGVVTHLAFGSECGDLEALQRVEACLSGESFQETLRRRLEGGETFARCRQAAVEELLDPRDAALLSQPNNILAIEYLKALRRADFPMEPITFPRRGGPHDGGAADGIASASHIRRLLRAGHTEEAMAFLPRESAEVLRREIAAGRGPVDMHTCQRAILARLRTMTEEEFSATLAFLEECRFAAMHVFPYSIRPGTKAADMPQVPGPVKEERAARAGALAARLHRAYLEECVGRTYPVLFEQPVAGRYGGHAPNYMEVAVSGGQDLHNRVLPVRITGTDGEILWGELE